MKTIDSCTSSKLEIPEIINPKNQEPKIEIKLLRDEAQNLLNK
jgi:hypothetical protein